MALRYSLGMGEEADRLERAISSTLDAGHRTADLARPGESALSTSQMGDAIVAALDAS